MPGLMSVQLPMEGWSGPGERARLAQLKLPLLWSPPREPRNAPRPEPREPREPRAEQLGLAQLVLGWRRVPERKRKVLHGAWELQRPGVSTQVSCVKRRRADESNPGVALGREVLDQRAKGYLPFNIYDPSVS